jgi:hypothetical protein
MIQINGAYALTADEMHAQGMQAFQALSIAESQTCPAMRRHFIDAAASLPGRRRVPGGRRVKGGAA